MRRNHLVAFSMTALLTFGCTPKEIANQAAVEAPFTPVAEATSASTNSTDVNDAANSNNVVAQPATKTGTFTTAEHPTVGIARIITEDGTRYLEFDESFKTDNGPDLFVILHRSEEPPISGIQEQDYVTLAPLQRTSGTQRYAIPEGINLEDFKSTVIWCRQFNANFGFATFTS